jgi:N-methylhydantoinase A
VRRGYDPRDFTLVASGGGGPAHVAALMAELGVKRVIVPPFPGTFSAWGMLLTEPRVDRIRTRVLRLESTPPDALEKMFATVEAEAIAALVSQGFAAGSLPAPRRALDMRYHGQEHTVQVPIADATALEQEALTAAFHERHRRQYTFALDDTPVEIVNFRVTATAPIARPSLNQRTVDDLGDPVKGVRPVIFANEPVATRILDRERMPAGLTVAGPAIIEEPSTTTVVHPGQSVAVDEWGNLVITQYTS